MCYFFHLSCLYYATYIELYICKPISISYLNFKAVLALPKTARSAQTNKSIGFIWIVLSTLCIYLDLKLKLSKNINNKSSFPSLFALTENYFKKKELTRFCNDILE